MVANLLINAHKNINLADSGGVWRRVGGLMENDGTYIVVGVMVGGGKWYLRSFRCGMVSSGYFFIGGVNPIPLLLSS